MRLLVCFSLFNILCSICLATAQADNSNDDVSKEVFVFVHGAWGGGWDYKNMAAILENLGHVVYRPTLTGLGEREHLRSEIIDLDTHIKDIENLLKFEELSNVVLVGHSYGGMVISGVAHKVPSRIERLVYVDAFLPRDGESVVSMLNDKRLAEHENDQFEPWEIPPFWENWGRDVPHPAATFKQAIQMQNKAANSIPGKYILTIEEGRETDTFSKFADRARKLGWKIELLKTGHNPHRTMPDQLASLLLSGSK